MTENELYHYGVVGMKWGVRRARRAYESGDSDTGQRIATRHQNKLTKKINKLDREYAGLSKKRDKQIRKNDVKAARMQKEANALRYKAGKRFSRQSKREKRLARAQVLDIKVNRLKSISDETKAAIYKNRSYRSTFSKGLNEVNDLIERGRAALTG